MYGYRIELYSKDQIKTINKQNSVELLPPWNSKYLQLIGFVKYDSPISIYDLENFNNFNFLRGSQPVFIQLDGVPKRSKYKVKLVERISL